MSILEASSLSRAPMAGLAAVGIFWGGFAAYVPEIKAQVGASDAAFGAALLAPAAGGILAMYFAPALVGRFGRSLLPAAAILLALAYFFPLLAMTVPALGAALFFMGVAVSLVDMSANMRISDLEEQSGRHLMNVNHAAFSFAFAAAALAASLTRREAMPAAVAFPIFAAAILALGWVMRDRRDWTVSVSEADQAMHSGLARPVALAAAVLFITFVAENACDSWSALHIERTLGGASGNGGFGPMMLGLTMGIGRLSGQVAAQKLGEAGLIFASTLVGIVGATLLALAPSVALALAGVALLGLGVAVAVPSVNSLLGKRVRAADRGWAISRAWMIGFTGFFVGPTLMGQVSELAGLRAAFLLIALLLVLALPAVTLLGRSPVLARAQA
ncbi:MFS transporter [Frigidibacter sp. SD6-1]|uniref:MFS transporter n=1 Tax=Frigidibacter sp. SD6-1 TaxID=3032581 RepID=UPI0024E00B17|nr:MFS transporter [Frigidibacter sp. SD6-1]